MILNFDRNKKGKCPTGNLFCSGVKIISISNFHTPSPPTHRKHEEKSLFIFESFENPLQTVGFRIVFNLNVYDSLWNILIVFSLSLFFFKTNRFLLLVKVPEIHFFSVKHKLKPAEIIINNK